MMKNYEVKRTDESGNTFYWLNDQLHRTDGPAIEYFSGSKSYYINNQLHREDGPAYTSRTLQMYCRYDKCHRLDGPAIYYHESDREEFWIDGKIIQAETTEEFLRYVKLRVFI